MSTPSNLYAEKVFAEHPTGLWALDDNADYVSLISEDKRVLSNPAKWDIVGGTIADYPESIGEPFLNSYVGRITANQTTSKTASVILTSKDIFDINKFNKYLRTFSVGAYFYSETSYVSGFEIGYQYTDQTSNQVITHLKNFDTIVNSNWVFISETFDAPPDNTLR